jgi:phosphatidylinositol glycan class V
MDIAVPVVRLGAGTRSRVSTPGYRATIGKCFTVSCLTFARNVGLFRYWTLPNFPLFVIAAPMLWLLLASSVTVLRTNIQPQLHGRPVPERGATADPTDASDVAHYVPELALPQLVLAVAAITSFHVQIVNRLASGYPTWYMIVATWLINDCKALRNQKTRQESQWVIRGMLTYAIAQGMLFANFLPPA